MYVTFGKVMKWSFKNTTRKNDAIVVLSSVCQNEAKKMPKLVNIDLKKIQKNSSIDLRFLKQDMEMEQVKQVKEDRVKKNVEKIVPELDLNQILSNFHWEASQDATRLEKSLQEEISALEASNIHGIIVSEEDSAQVLEKIESSLFQLNQIDEWLSHYVLLLEVTLVIKDLEYGAGCASGRVAE